MATIKGTNGDDRGDFALDGTSDNDSIYGYNGDDDLYGNGGNDVLKGGYGDDDLWGGSGINNLYGGDGQDWFRMSTRGSTLSDDYIADFEFGRDKIDVASWGASDFSQIQALLTSDSDGNAVFNAYYGGKNHFVTVGDVSKSELISSDFNFSTRSARDIYGSSSSDVLFGTLYDDLIHGNGGNDKLLGGKGDDHIYGDSGDDRIYGGQGADTMNGGSGDDRFVFNFASESYSNGNIDYITDFTLDHDRIDVSGIDAKSSASGNQTFEWIGHHSFDGSGQLGYAYSGDDTIVSGNTDSDSAAEFQIALKGHLSLIDDDFIL